MEGNRIIRPEQLVQNRADEAFTLANHIWSQILPAMEHNMFQALSALSLQMNTIVIALRNKGVLNDEELTKASEEARKVMEERQKAFEAAQKQEPSGPKIISPEQLEGLGEASTTENEITMPGQNSDDAITNN